MSLSDQKLRKHRRIFPAKITSSNGGALSLMRGEGRDDHEGSGSPTGDEQQQLPLADGNPVEGEAPSNDRTVRLAKAQAEIDRILKSPLGAPFDIESEMKYVTSIAPAVIEEGSAEQQVEQVVSDMERQLYDAVEQKDYEKAQKHQEAISQYHIDDCAAVLQVNRAFYKAFSDKDFEAMEALWLKDNTCVCIHPSQKPLAGASEVLKTWKRMFESNVGSFQKSWMEPDGIRLSVKGTMAVVTCEENVYYRRFVRGKKRETELTNKLQATNIFRKVGNKWHMTYHHSSWHADSDAAKQALKEGSSVQSSNKPPPSSPVTSLSNAGLPDLKPRIDIRARNAGGNSNSSNNSNADGESKISGIESILGIPKPGPLLGDDNAADGNVPQKPRIFTGSLSDLLGGDLGDVIGGGDGISNLNGGLDKNGMPPSNGAIIKISKLTNRDGEVVHFDADQDDEYDDDDDDGEYDDDDEQGHSSNSNNNNNNNNGASIMQLPFQKNGTKNPRNEQQQHRHHNNNNSNDDDDSDDDEYDKDMLRQDCISALRRLANQGRISSKQKRVLLTDIISCSAKDEFSMVEVAYELLCSGSDGRTNKGKDGNGDEDEDDTAEEEFADQCRVFADTFLTDSSIYTNGLGGRNGQLR